MKVALDYGTRGSYGCAWKPKGHLDGFPVDSEAAGYIKDCILAHEGLHKDRHDKRGDCTDAKDGERPGVEENELNKEELEAYNLQLECLKKAHAKCTTLTCMEDIIREQGKTEGLRDDYQRKVNRR